METKGVYMKVFARRAVTAFFAAASVIGLSGGLVAAQTENRSANGFRISPVRSEYTIEKGKSETLTITVENPTDIATIAKPIVNDFVASNKEDGEPLLILDDKETAPKNSFVKLVGTLEDTPLGPKEKKEINVRISIPEDANAGGYYGAIRFAPGVAGEVSNVGLTASVGTIVLVRVPGDLVEKMSLVELTSVQGDKAKGYITSGDVSIMVRLKNDGDIHIKPFGRIEIKDMFGKVVHSYEVNNKDPRSNVLPGSTRKFTDALPQKKWLGRYTVTANLASTAGSGDLITAKATFWYVPVWALAVLIVLIVLIVGGVLLAVRRLRGGRPKHGAKHKE